MTSVGKSPVRALRFLEMSRTPRLPCPTTAPERITRSARLPGHSRCSSTLPSQPEPRKICIGSRQRIGNRTYDPLGDRRKRLETDMVCIHYDERNLQRVKPALVQLQLER